MTEVTNPVNWVKVVACIAAGFCMAIGTVGPALGQGFLAGKACESIGKRPESAGLITRTMIVALVFVESSAIYALLISLILLFVIAR